MRSVAIIEEKRSEEPEEAEKEPMSHDHARRCKHTKVGFMAYRKSAKTGRGILATGANTGTKS